MASLGSFDFVGSEKDLAFRIGKDNRALVAAFRDDVAARRCLTLPNNKLTAHGRIIGRKMDHGGDIEFANRISYVDSVQQHAIAWQLNADLRNKLAQGVSIGEI